MSKRRGGSEPRPGTGNPNASAAAAGGPANGTDFPWKIVLILTALNILSYADRQLMALLSVPIQESLGIDDVGLGLLQGLAFSVVFTLASIPAGWAVDYLNRARIIYAGVTIWSAATVACGMATSFWHLFAGRVGVGAGEASLSPSAHAILSETTPRGRLGLALGIYSVGANVGIAFSLVFGGIVVAIIPKHGISLPHVGTVEPWQAAFLLLGAPGFLMALLAFLLPHGARFPSLSASGSKGQGATSVFAHVRAEYRAFGPLLLGFSMIGFAGYAVASWAPAFLSRNFGWGAGQIGAVLGGAVGISGLVGTLTASSMADRLFRSKRDDAYYLVAVVTTLIGGPLLVAAFLSKSVWLCVTLLALGYMFLGSFGGVASAALQLMTPSHFRGRMGALYVFTFNIVGLGLAPLAVGIVTEHLFGDRQMVGQSVALAVAISCGVSVLCLFSGRKEHVAQINLCRLSRG